LPERQSGETTRTYWLRALLAADPAQRQAQRAVVHAAAHAVLGMTLDKGDLRLLGQLRRAAGSWGTVLHWILKTGDVAAVDVRAYLYGFLRHQDHPAPRKADPFGTLTTPLVVDDQDGDEASQDEAAASPAVEEDVHQTCLRKLGHALRAHRVWQAMGEQGLPVGGPSALVERLAALQGQGAWTLAEFVWQVVVLANPAQMPSTTPSQRWEYVLRLLEQRAQTRAQRHGKTALSSVPASVAPVVLPPPVVEVLPAAPAAPDPAQVSRRAHALRRLCGAGTEFGQTLLAYIELAERDALEEIATTLLVAAVPEEQTEAVLRRAWQEIVRLGGSVATHTRPQRQHHWRMGLKLGISTLRRPSLTWRMGALS